MKYNAPKEGWRRRRHVGAAAVGQSDLHRLKSTGSQGRKQVQLSFPVKEERRDGFLRHQSPANWAPVGDTAAA